MQPAQYPNGRTRLGYLHVLFDAKMHRDSLHLYAAERKMIVACSRDASPEVLAALEPDLADAIVSLAESEAR